MIGKIKDGGFNMPNFKIINKSLKASWVKRFLNPQTQSWKKIPFDQLHHVGGPLLFECNVSIKTLPELPFLPLFYRDVLRGCLSKIHPLKFAKKIILPETLATERLYQG